MKELTDKQLIVRITGSVQQSNLAEFEQTALAVISGINTDLQTDDDFVQAEQDVKDCSLIETRLAQAKSDALNGTKEISGIILTIDRLTAKFRNTRLDLDKKVKTEKEKRRNEIIFEATKKLEQTVSLSPVKHGFVIDRKAIQDAVKGKKSIAKMREAVDSAVAVQLAELSVAEVNYKTNLIEIEKSENEFPGLYPDKKNLALSAPEVIQAEIERRVIKFKFEIAEKVRKEKEEAERKAEQERKEALAVTQAPVEQGGYFQGRQPIVEPDPIETVCPTPTLPPDPFIDWTPPAPPTIATHVLSVSAYGDIDEIVSRIKDIPGVIFVGVNAI